MKKDTIAFALRIPPEIYAAMVELARAENRSLNAQIVTAMTINLVQSKLKTELKK